MWPAGSVSGSSASATLPPPFFQKSGARAIFPTKNAPPPLHQDDGVTMETEDPLVTLPRVGPYVYFRGT